MEVIIDRFEGDYAIVEINEGEMVNLPKVLVPKAQEGDIVNITILKEKRKEREEKIASLMQDIFED